VIQRKRRDYLDPNSSSNMKKLNDDLQSIHSIMRKTIDDVLDRCVRICYVVLYAYVGFSPAAALSRECSLSVSSLCITRFRLHTIITNLQRQQAGRRERDLQESGH
jgi:hypothetical protein